MPSIADDFFEDLPDETPLSREQYNNWRESRKSTNRHRAAQDLINEVGEVPPPTPEAIALRDKYVDDYISMHQEIFTRSSGIKPFGQVQINSIQRSHYNLTHGGRSVIVEPRGFGKTSRNTNNSLAGVLQGKRKYVLILASSVQKAEDIIDGIKTELIDNEKLAELYPAVCACFQHAGDNFQRARNQTYRGERTHIKSTKNLIRMPVIAGEPSSGAVIQVRPKDNVRGLAVKVRYGEDKLTVLRPDFFFMDDIQTDEEAESPTSVRKIITIIKKSVLFAGTHAKRISGVLCATPIAPGDVPSHFALNEHGWDVVESKMMVKMPTRMDLWLGEYANIIRSYDKHVLGSRQRAEIRAKEFLEANYEEMHEGAVPAWDWAYGWQEIPQTEISATQHAMNILIVEGEDAFETECQCTLRSKVEEVDGVRATIDEIIHKTHNRPRYRTSVAAKYVCTHIDVNKRLLTYATLASPVAFRPEIIDYGEWPRQEGAVWKKAQVVYSLERTYPDVPEEDERIYLGVKDLLNQLVKRQYLRDDGLPLYNQLILVDQRYKIDAVQRAIIDSEARSITSCAAGQGLQARDRPFMERHYGSDCTKHWHCATVPTNNRLLTALYMDVNYFKTVIHKGYKARIGINSSYSLFSPETASGHLLFAKHHLTEVPREDTYEKEDRRIIVWGEESDDNEYFDNVVGATAGLFKLGCEIHNKRAVTKTYSMQDYINKQKK